MRPRALAAAAALLVAAVACTRERHPLQRLAAETATLDERPVTARLEGFPHRPPPAANRRTRKTTISSAIRLRGMAGSALASNALTGREAAVARLLAGDRRGAVEGLSAVAAQHPDDPGVWSDLAAARFELAAADDDVAMYGQSLAAADRALRIQPSSPPARFNRALALAALSLDDAAVRALESYVALDAQSAWSAEARQRLAALRRPKRADEWNAARKVLEQGNDVEAIALRFPQQARTYAESECLARWAERSLAGDSAEASRWLGIARVAGGVRARKFGDTLLADAVRTIDANPASASLARAHLTYRDGRKAYATGSARVLEALPLLEKAEREFASAGSPLALVAGYYRANALVSAHEVDAARELLERIRATAPASYRALHAELLWLRSTIAGSTGQPYESLDAAQRSADEFRKLGEDEHAARMASSATTALRRLGRVREARDLRRRVFASASSAGKASLWELVLNSAARNELLERQWDVAASLFAVELESETVSPRVRFDALLWRAVAEARAYGTALPDLRAARAAADRIPDAAMREEVERELDFVEGASLVPADAPRAAQLLTNVIDYRTRTSNLARLSVAYLERARAQLAAKRPGEAEADLRAALAADERVAGSIARNDLRDTFFGGIDEAFDLLVELLVQEHRLAEAVDVAERYRARGLAEAAARSRNVAASLDAIAEGVPRDSALVHYTTLPAGTLVSVIARGRHREFVVAASRQQLAERNARLLDAVGRDAAAERQRLARELHELLVAPVRAELAGASEVVIVPDETIAAVPFAMLTAPTGRHLAEDFVLVHAASASMFLRHSREAVRAHDSSARFAVVADPAFDSALFPQLERLPAAQRDASWLAPGRAAEVLTGSDATPSRVEAALAKCRVAHLATHAIADPNDAWSSLFALAPEPASRGTLYLHQLARRDLRALRLVTLAGCRTGSFGGGRGSVRSLSRAFLAAGAHNVVATLWNVEDSATSRATEELYRALDEGLRPAAALQRAQLAMLRSGNPNWASPKTWASLQLQGCNR